MQPVIRSRPHISPAPHLLRHCRIILLTHRFALPYFFASDCCHTKLLKLSHGHQKKRPSQSKRWVTMVTWFLESFLSRLYLKLTCRHLGFHHQRDPGDEVESAWLARDTIVVSTLGVHLTVRTDKHVMKDVCYCGNACFRRRTVDYAHIYLRCKCATPSSTFLSCSSIFVHLAGTGNASIVGILARLMSNKYWKHLHTTVTGKRGLKKNI